MKACPECGAEVSPDMKFCAECGSRLDVGQSTVSYAPSFVWYADFTDNNKQA